MPIITLYIHPHGTIINYVGTECVRFHDEAGMA